MFWDIETWISKQKYFFGSVSRLKSNLIYSRHQYGLHIFKPWSLDEKLAERTQEFDIIQIRLNQPFLVGSYPRTIFF